MTAEADDRAYHADHLERSTLRLGGQVGLAGAMGIVHEVAGGEHYYKEYFEPARHAVRLSRLIAWRNKLAQNQRDFVDAHCAWPLMAVTSEGAIVGFLMNPAPDQFWADMAGERHTMELQHLIHSAIASRIGIVAPDRAERLALVADLASILAFLGRRDIVYGDVNEKNILWTLSGAPQVYLIDCDNARPADLVGSAANVAMAKNDSWRDPYLAKGDPPDLNSDRYSMAVFCYRVFYAETARIGADQEELLIRNSAPQLPDLEQLLRNGVGAPRFRPSAGRWVSAIAMIDKAALDVVVPRPAAAPEPVTGWPPPPPAASDSPPVSAWPPMPVRSRRAGRLRSPMPNSLRKKLIRTRLLRAWRASPERVAIGTFLILGVIGLLLVLLS